MRLNGKGFIVFEQEKKTDKWSRDKLTWSRSVYEIVGQKSSSSSRIMKSPKSILQHVACICVTVILLIQTTLADQQDLVHHSHNQNALYKDMTGPTSGKIQTLDVICGKNFMTVRAEFAGPFYGIVFSKGTYGQENCIYVKPNSGLTHAAFNVYYDQCGTKPDLQGKFYENTIVIQYGSDIIEAYDEAKRLRCEWFEAYEKPATFKPAIPVADLEVVEMNFQGDDIDCWMEIQDGIGPWSREVSKIVPVGQPMTIVVSINDYNGQFDMRVKSCVAHDGVQPPISLTDEFGCVLRPKMLTPFTKIKNPGGAHRKATVLSYSRFLAFKFPDSMTVQIQCTVEVCRHGCADACQRVPSIAATTLQPELSLTAKWPAADQRPAIEMSPADVGLENQQHKPPRRQFNNRPQQVEENRRSHIYTNPAPQRQPNQGDFPDDMSSSDSNLRPALVSVNNQQHQRSVQDNGNRRSQESMANEFDGHIPQYMLPPDTRRAQSSNNRPTIGTPATSTTVVPSTTVRTSSQSSQVENNRALADDMSVAETANEGSIASEPQGSKANEREPETSNADQQDAKAEASQVKPSIVSTDQEQQKPGQTDQSYDDKSSLAANKPSVQARDEAQDKTDQAQISGSPINSDSSSSLKTVEVEIPANEDPVRSLITSSSNNPTQSGQFNSVRLSNVDLGANNYGYDNNQDLVSDSRQPNNYKQKVSFSPEQVIQPRETNPNRDRNDASNLEVSMMSSGKGRFGARSQPQSTVQVDSGTQQQQHSFSNHQMQSTDNQNLKESLSAINSDKVLIDRSDDSSSLTEVASSGSSNGELPNRSEEFSGHSMDDESSVSSIVDNTTGGKVKPVVGTEELATGPLQLEDRMGSPALESLEKALSKLQQQIPLSAALVSSSSIESKKQEEDKSVEEPSRSDSEKPSDAISRPDSGNNDRADVETLLSQHKKQQADQLIAQQSQKTSSSIQRDINQPYPNIAGQAKVMPDPSNGLNTRGSMLTQASNSDGAKVVVAPIQAQSQAQPINSEKQQLAQNLNSKPIAQITNIPINLGFPQNQGNNMQQFTHQLALLQQAQQQQQQVKQTTPKPTRSRFNLLSPQAALQAVASRFLPKSTTQAPQQQQQPQQQQPAINPQILKFTPEQHKLLSPQMQQRATNFFLSQQNPQAQQYLISRLNSAPQPPQLQPAPSASLFGRLNSVQQPSSSQPLVRSRRSVIMPNGQQGNGELGITKSFMVVTGMDLAFQPNFTDVDLPSILKGRHIEDDVIYGVCMPVVSLTFVLTCAFWMIVFLFTFCVYMLIKTRRQRENLCNKEVN